jgi:cytochrome P450
MRLYPPNRSVSREALNDDEIGGYHVPAGAQVLMSQWIVHRDARYFFNPTEFVPERWTGNLLRELPRYAYFPFGGGPRVCVGQEFAVLEAMTVIATILRKFKLESLDGSVMEPEAGVLLRPGSDVWIRVTDRVG